MKHTKTSAILAISLSVMLLLSGCTFASAMQQLQKYLPIALQAAEEVLAILVSAGIVTPANQTQVQTDFTNGNAALGDCLAAVNAYLASPSASQPAQLPRVIQALQNSQTAFAAVIKDLGLNPSNNAIVTAQLALQSVITTLAAIEANLPTPTPTPTAKARVPIPSASAFKAQFNEIMKVHGFGDHQLK